MIEHGVRVPVTAALDRHGRLLRADEALLRLQAEAGGDPQGPIALPALAALVRLVMRLRVPLSRGVELARDETDVSLWVQIRPDGEGLHLAIVDWQERKAKNTLPRSAMLRSVADWETGPGWLWQVDHHMRFGATDTDPTLLGHAPPRQGDSLASYFVLEGTGEDSEEGMPIISALASHASFADQPAHLRSSPAIRYLISGTPLFDPTGGFIGYRGRAARAEAVRRERAAHNLAHAAADPADTRGGELFGPSLGRRLDQALRQPLDRIIANAATISERRQGPLRQDYANYATDIAVAGRHLLALVDDLADLQAVERPDFSTASEDVDLAELARRAAGLLNVRAEAQNVRIQAPTPDERLLARAEYRRVLQILFNLIGNAVRHSPPESTIWVRVDDEDSRVKVIVADQGMGIAPEDHTRIFDRFERLGNNDGEGSGLGLYISRMLARAMGGDVTLESSLGMGARFTLDLPAWEANVNGFKAG